MIFLVIKAWNRNGTGHVYGLCGQLLLTMFTFIFWPCQIINATTFVGNSLGNEMYSNMLAVLFLFQHTFSLFLLYFAIQVCLYQLPSLSTGSFCSFMAKPCQISFFVCRLLSLTFPDTISTTSKLSWQMTWPQAEQFSMIVRLECFRIAVWWGNVRKLFDLDAWNLRRTLIILSRPVLKNCIYCIIIQWIYYYILFYLYFT